MNTHDNLHFHVLIDTISLYVNLDNERFWIESRKAKDEGKKSLPITTDATDPTNQSEHDVDNKRHVLGTCEHEQLVFVTIVEPSKQNHVR